MSFPRLYINKELSELLDLVILSEDQQRRVEVLSHDDLVNSEKLIRQMRERDVCVVIDGWWGSHMSASTCDDTDYFLSLCEEFDVEYHHCPTEIDDTESDAFAREEKMKHLDQLLCQRRVSISL